MPEKNNKTEVKNAFKIHGLNLKVEGCDYVVDLVKGFSDDTRKDWLNRLLASVQKLPLEDCLIGIEELEEAVAECSQQSNDRDNVLNVIDSFTVPRLEYDSERKKFIEWNGVSSMIPSLLHPEAKSKFLLYKNRLTAVKQRTMRHDLFASSSYHHGSTPSSSHRFKLSNVEDVLSSSQKTNAVLLGILTQLRGNKYYIEDDTGHIQLDFTNTEYHTGLICESSIILIEGKGSRDGVFYVAALGFPPIETAAKTREYFGDLNFFGGPLPKAVCSSEKLKIHEQNSPDAFFVILSDLWVDDRKVLEQFGCLLNGFVDAPPVAFILCGAYLSKAHGINQHGRLKEGFNDLAEIILAFGDLAERTSFIFVPGMDDPVLGHILPRPGVSMSLIQPMVTQIPNCYFSSNPCRIQYCTQEIVVFREDIVEKMCRNCIHVPSDKKDIPMHVGLQFVKTIQSQGHLTPLPVHVSPVYWDYDHALRLYPLPDLVVLADKFDPFYENANGSMFTNPSSFARNNWSFQVYIPSSRVIEDSAVPPPEQR